MRALGLLLLAVLLPLGSRAAQDSLSLVRPSSKKAAKPKAGKAAKAKPGKTAKAPPTARTRKTPLKPSLLPPEEEAAAARPQPAPATPEPAPPSPPPVPAAGTAHAAGQDRQMTAFGLTISRSDPGWRVEQVLSRSEADALGLRPGDELLSLNGAGTDQEPPARALGALAPQSRRSAVVRRGLEILALEEGLPGLKASSSRRAVLTPRESAMARRRSEEALRRGPAAVRELPLPHFRVHDRQALWLSFPQGLPLGLRENDVVEGRTVTPTAAEEDLDFLVLPPGSAVWARVVSVRQTKAVTAVRLHLFKLQPQGGHVYPVSGALTDVSGGRLLTKVSPGGTVVTAAPPQDNPPLLLGNALQYRAELLSPLTLFEGPAFFRAGVGLWFKGSPGGFEVTKVVPGRSADLAGIAVGDLITGVDGASAAKLDLGSAIGRLYGAPGSSVRVRLRRKDSAKEDSLSLVRGMRYESGTGLRARPAGAALEILEVASDSSAGREGLRPGDRILLIGDRAAADIPAERLQKLLSGDLLGDNALTVLRPGAKDPRRLSIKRGWVGVPLPPPYRTRL